MSLLGDAKKVGFFVNALRGSLQGSCFVRILVPKKETALLFEEYGFWDPNRRLLMVVALFKIAFCFGNLGVIAERFCGFVYWLLFEIERKGEKGVDFVGWRWR